MKLMLETVSWRMDADQADAALDALLQVG